MMDEKLPEGWVWTTLEEVVEIRDDLRSPVNADERAQRFGPYPYYGATGQVGWIEGYLMDGEYVLLGEDGAPFLDSLKPKAYMVSGKVWVNNHAHVLRFFESLGNNSFLMHVLNTLNYSNVVSGTTRLKLTQAAMRKMLIPLAPLSEQTRIVAAIERQFARLDSAVASLKSAQAKIPQYRASLLKSAVEGELTREWRAAHPAEESGADLLKRILAERRARWEEAQLAKMRARGETPWNDEWKKAYKEPKGPDVENLPALPQGWCWATVEQVGTYLRNGLPQKPQISPPGYRILRINAVRPMQVNLNEVRYLPLSENEVQDYIIENGDILFTRYNGSLDLLGVAGMVRGCSEPTLHPDKLIRLITVLKEPFSSFLEIACNTGISRAFVESRARTTAGQKGIAGSDIKQIPLPLPPLAEQAQIVAEVEAKLSEIAKMEEVIEHSLRRAELERQSILREAFAGRLVEQNPEDEPASVLLERIREERRKRAELEKERRKGERTMRKQEFVYKSTEAKLYHKLAEARAPMEPGELFRQAGFKIDTEMDEPEPAEQFFTGVDHLASAGAIAEERPDDRTVLLRTTDLPEEQVQALLESAEQRVADQNPQPEQADLWKQ